MRTLRTSCAVLFLLSNVPFVPAADSSAILPDDSYPKSSKPHPPEARPPFNPDPGQPPVRPAPPLVFDPVYHRDTRTSPAPGPASPGAFNPDPGSQPTEAALEPPPDWVPPDRSDERRSRAIYSSPIVAAPPADAGRVNSVNGAEASAGREPQGDLRAPTVPLTPPVPPVAPPSSYETLYRGQGSAPPWENSEPRPDRWRIELPEWKRYADPSIETPYQNGPPALWHPYRQSLLKGDAPILGQDKFLRLDLDSNWSFETRLLPAPGGLRAAPPGQIQFIRRSRQHVFQHDVMFGIDFFKGEAALRPPDWRVKIVPAAHASYISVEDEDVVLRNLDGSESTRRDFRDDRFGSHFTLRQAFLELPLKVLTPTYDFVAARAGVQPFNSDFRGLLFNDTNLGLRLFGNAANNLYQYNLALFPMLEKDTFSNAVRFESRDQWVAVANVYRQDFLFPGYTVQASFHANIDDGNRHENRFGTQTRPWPSGLPREHRVEAYYFGLAGHGRIGRLNLSHAMYQVLGRDEFNSLAGQGTGINAQLAALELSMDFDWLRPKVFALYASGDADATDSIARGFDTIADQSTFLGGSSSYYARQGFNLGAAPSGFKPAFGLLPNLSHSRSESQANFVNPGLWAIGTGLDASITPKLQASASAGYLCWVESDPMETIFQMDDLDEELGWDLSASARYRPGLTDNCILTASLGFLIPGSGLRKLNGQAAPDSPSRRTGDHKLNDILYHAHIAIRFRY